MKHCLQLFVFMVICVWLTLLPICLSLLINLKALYLFFIHAITHNSCNGLQPKQTDGNLCPLKRIHCYAVSLHFATNNGCCLFTKHRRLQPHNSSNLKPQRHAISVHNIEPAPELSSTRCQELVPVDQIGCHRLSKLSRIKTWTTHNWNLSGIWLGD